MLSGFKLIRSEGVRLVKMAFKLFETNRANASTGNKSLSNPM